MISNKVTPLSQKEIKAINEFNQVAKKVFKAFYLTNTGVLYTDNDKATIDKGFHIAKSKNDIFNSFFCTDGYIICLMTDYIYKAIKEDKKNIDKLIFSSHSIFFVTNSNKEYPIGTIHRIDSSNEEKNTSFCKLEESLNNKGWIHLENEVINLLCNNELVTYVSSNEKYKLRFTKQIIPGLKPDSKVDIYFDDIDESKNVFSSTFRIDREELISYHQYICSFF